MQPATDPYDSALSDLGRVLENTGWRPELPLGTTLDAARDPQVRWKILALLFLEANKKLLQSALCLDGNVRPGIGLGADMIAHTAAHLSGLNLLEASLISPIASVLCHLGLAKFCIQ